MGHSNTIAELVDESFVRFEKRQAFVYKEPFRTRSWTYGEIANLTSAMQAYLHEKGVKKGDKVMVCAPNSPWWVITYFACARMGVILVPADFNSHPDFIDSVAKLTKPKLCIISAYKATNLKTKTIIIEDLKRLLKDQKQASLPSVTIAPEDTLEIVFTSGSTGDPKGVVLTHGNVAANVGNLLTAWNIGNEHTLLSLIPLSHMLEQTVGLFTPFASGSKIVYLASVKPSAITAALKSEAVTTLIIVPAFLSLLRRRIITESAEKGKDKVLKAMLNASSYLPVALRRVLFMSVNRKIGPKLKYLVVGGAPLPIELEEFWSALGMHILQGYGMTESAPIATYSLHTSKKPGSVGMSLPNQSIRIADDGEILMKGPHVFDGYYKNRKATAGVIKDGWLHTGDIGELDVDGFLFLRGRKKNMLLSENGLNIYPEDIEGQLMNSAQIKDVVVLLSKQNGGQKLTAVFSTDLPLKAMKSIVNKANAELAAHQAIQSVVIWPNEDFPRTATRKVKRKEVQEFVDNKEQISAGKQAAHTPVEEVLLLVVPSAKKIGPKQVLSSDLGLDSLKRLELVTLLEEKLFAVVGEDQIDQTTTVSQLEVIVKEALKNPYKTSYNLILSEKEPLMTLRAFIQRLLFLGPSLYQKLTVPELPVVDEPVVFVANHSSHYDSLTFLRWFGMSRKYLAIAAAKDYFFDNSAKAWAMRRGMSAFPIDREGNIKQSLLTIGTYLDAGKSILIFPEGTRSQDGKLQSFKPGIGLIAQQLDVPVIPVKMTGNYEILPKGRSWPRRGATTLIAGKPLRFERTTDTADIVEKIHAAIEAL